MLQLLKLSNFSTVGLGTILLLLSNGLPTIQGIQGRTLAHIVVSPFQDGTTPLILSAAMGHAECVKELLIQGADPACCRTVCYMELYELIYGLFGTITSK